MHLHAYLISALTLPTTESVNKSTVCTTDLLSNYVTRVPCVYVLYCTVPLPLQQFCQQLTSVNDQCPGCVRTTLFAFRVFSGSLKLSSNTAYYLYVINNLLYFALSLRMLSTCLLSVRYTARVGVLRVIRSVISHTYKVLCCWLFRVSVTQPAVDSSYTRSVFKAVKRSYRSSTALHNALVTYTELWLLPCKAS